MTSTGTNPARRHGGLRSHVALVAMLIALLAVAGMAGALVASAQAPSTSGAMAQAAAKKKPKKKAKKKPAAKKKMTCAVQSLNRKLGKYQTVYVTKRVKVKVKRNGRTVTVTRTQKVAKQGPCMCPQTKTVNGKKTPVHITLFVQKPVRKHGKVVKKNGKVQTKRTKVKVLKLVSCASQSSSGGGAGSGSSLGLPVTITLIPPSNALLDFQAFQRTAPLSGTIKGFFVGGFKPNQDNKLTVSGAHIRIGETAIFIDDVCGGQVSAAIQTDPSSFAQIDPTSASDSNTVTIDAAGKITGLIHLRIQTALLLRNDDSGCNQPYIPTGWTDLSVPIFLSGKLVGLSSTIETGETVLDDLSACLAPGPPTLPCNGFAIPFPAIFSSTLVGNATIGS